MVPVAGLSVLLAFAGQSAFGTGFDFVLSNMQFSGTNSTGAFVTFDVTASHDTEGTLTPVCSPESGSFLPAGESVISCSATDLEDNTATAEFTVSVLTSDATSPTVTAFPPGGTYSSQQSVTLSADEPATIYYTTDGSTPTTASPVYSSAIPISSTTTLRFFAQDFAGISSSVITESYVIIQDFPVTHMSDTTTTYGLNLFSSRQAHVEFVTPSSQLVGDKIDRMTLSLKRVGSPTDMAEVGVFNSDLSVKKLFGTLDVASLPTSYTDLTFSLPSELYNIEAGDRIGIKYAGGDSSNLIAVMTDQDPADPFDGANSYHQYYTTQWISFTNGDMYMALIQTHDGIDATSPTVTAFPPGGTYSSQQSVTLSADEPATIYYTTDGSTPTTASPVYSSAIAITALGTTTLKFFGVDAAANTGTIQTETYTINDTVRPTVSITSPTAGQSIQGPSTGVIVDVQGTAFDDGGIQIVEVRTQNTSYQPATPSSPGDWSTWTHSRTFVTEGSHTLIARATDNSGNVQWFTVNITITFTG